MSNLKYLEKVLRECRNYKTIIKILELNKKIHAKDNEYIEKQDEKIKYYTKMNLNIERCLQTLNADELEFIQEIYFNNKTYREIISIIKRIQYGDENIDKKIIINIGTLINCTSTKIKKTILNKLLNENILGVI